MSCCSNFTSAVRIVAFGELLWDMLPSGKKLGGAPVNFLYHAKTLGAEVLALTSVGNDELGKEIQDRLDALDVSQDALQISQQAPTGTVDVTLDDKGVPSYRIVENVAWDFIQIEQAELDQIIEFLTKDGTNSAFYFGSLALRTSNNKAAVARILNALPENVMRVCDLNLRAPFYDRETIAFTLENSDVFKLNDVEALELEQIFADKLAPSLAVFADADRSLSEALRDNFEGVKEALTTWAELWLKTYGLKTIVLTCGASGAFIVDAENVVYSPSLKVDVKDSVGAGDSFAAVCVVGFLLNHPYQQIIEAASKRAAFVCSQEGATPIVPKELAAPFD